MKKLYVERDDTGKIITVYSRVQYPTQKRLLESDPELIAFFAAPPPQTQEEFIDFVFGNDDFGHVLFEILFELYALIPGPPVTRDGFKAILKNKIP